MSKVARVYISSNDRVSGTATDFTVHFPPQRIHNVFKIDVESVILPSTIYNITSSNNNITMTNNATTQFSVQIPVGSYNVNTLASTIVTLFDDAGFGDPLVITYNAITFKFTIENTIGAYSLDVVSGGNDVYTSMNLTPQSSALVGGKDIIVSGAVLFGIPLYCFVESSQLNVSSHVNSLSSNRDENHRAILAKIPISENSGTNVIFKDYSREEAVGDIDLQGVVFPQSIDIKIRFPSNETFSLEAGDVSLVLHVHYR